MGLPTPTIAHINARALLPYAVCVLGACALPLALSTFGLDVTDSGWALVLSRDFFIDPESVANASPCYLTLYIGAVIVKVFGDYVGALRATAFVPYAISAIAALLLIRTLPRRTAWSAVGVVAAGVVGWSEFALNWLNYNTVSACFSMWAFCLLFLGCRRITREHKLAATSLLLATGLCTGLAIASRAATGATLAGVVACILAYGVQRVRIAAIVTVGIVLSGAAVTAIAADSGHLQLLVKDLRDFMGSAIQGTHKSHSSLLLIRVYTVSLIVSTLYGSTLLILAWFAQRELTERTMCSKPIASAVAVCCLVGIMWFRRDSLLIDLSCLMAIALLLHTLSSGASDRLLVVVALTSWALFALGSSNGFKNSCFALYLMLPVSMNQLASSPFGRIAKAALLLLIVAGVARGIAKPYRDQPIYALDTGIHTEALGHVRTTAGRAAVVSDTVREVMARTQPGQRILVYQNSPMLYVLSDTRPWIPYPWPMTHLFARVSESINEREATELPRLIVRETKSAQSYTWPNSSSPSADSLFTPLEFNDFAQSFERRHGFQVVHENQMYVILAQVP